MVRSMIDQVASVPKFEKLLWPTLEVLKQTGGSATVQEIEEKVIDIANITEAQQSILHGKGPQSEVNYRLAWARTYLKKVGAVENSSRGIWTVTDKGRALKEVDMAGIPTAVRAASTRELTPGAEEDGKPVVVSNMFSSTETEVWRDRLLQVLQALPPEDFEKLCQRLLRESGFTKVAITGRSGDGGIDGVGVLRISLLNFQVFFQCKRYKGSVGSSAIRDFRGAMVGRSDKGLVITTGSFTADAQREATRDGAPVLDLIDGDQLCRLLKELKLGVTTREVEEVTIDPAWFTTI